MFFQSSNVSDLGKVYFKLAERFLYIDDKEALNAFYMLSKHEGIIPALESSHAVAQGIKIAKQSTAGTKILINLSGRGDKDLDFILKKIGH